MHYSCSCSCLLYYSRPEAAQSLRGEAVRGEYTSADPQMVFTGIVEEMGTVVSMTREENLVLWCVKMRCVSVQLGLSDAQATALKPAHHSGARRDGSRGSGFILKVKMEKGLIDAYEGASIMINGVCLTVLEWPVKNGVVSFGVAPETIKLTNLVRMLSVPFVTHTVFFC